MRLDKHTCQIIQEEVAKQFGIRAVVRLFGSRTDDLQRGGDIDLYIKTKQQNAEVINKNKIVLFI